MHKAILKNKSLWLSLLLTLLFFNVKSQDPYFDHYTEDLELPTNQIYGMVIDEYNILYMASDRGVVQYDGYSFKTYTIRDGLEDNCMLRMSKDKKNRIWLTSIENTCNFILKGKVYTPPFNDSLKKQSSHEHYVQNIFVTAEDEKFITFDYPGVFKVDGDDLKALKEHENQVDGAIISIFKTPDGYYWDQFKEAVDDPNFITRDTLVDNIIYISTSLVGQSGHHRKELVEISKDEFLFSFEKRLFHFKSDTIYEEQIFEKEILSLFYDKVNRDIWVGLADIGAYQLKDGNIKSKPKKYLNGQTITGIIRDHENNYWFSTHDNGVYRANNLEFPIFIIDSTNQNGNRITALAAADTCLFVGTNDGLLYKLSKKTKEKYSIQPVKFKENGPIRGLFTTSHGSLVVLSDHLTEIQPDGELTGFKDFNTYPYAFIEIDSVTSILSLTRGITQYVDHIKDTIFTSHNGFLKVRKIHRDRQNTFWFSSQPYGIYTWKPGSDPMPAKKLDSIQPNIHLKRSLAFEEIQEHMLFAPAGEGILLSLPDTILRFEENDENGLSSNIIDDMIVRKNDLILWAATSKGLNRIDFSMGLRVKPKISIINTRNGLPSNRVFCLEEFDGEVWAGTGLGLVKIHSEYGSKSKLHKPIVEYMTYNDKDTLWADDTYSQLPLDQPFNLKFRYRAISYHQPHKVIYHYLLHPFEKKWNNTTNLEMRYTGIGHGTYTMYITASDDYTLPDPGPPENLNNFTTFEFSIPKKFHETLFFILLTIAGSLLLLTLIILLIIRSLKNKERNKQRLLLAEKKALLAQMNPHFIFNSLNSIQHYIIQQDSENANIYLAKFSQLIRRILDNSKRKSISLGEEIDTLMLYLNLEKLRFEDNFDFELVKDKKLDHHEIMVPPMLIQPFVENAIWHGLMPLKGKGFLKIHFTRINDRMDIYVEDNGIGRVKSSKKKRIVGHAATGLKNLFERISLINKISDRMISCEIIDLYNPEGKPTGTQVKLSIPIHTDDEKWES